MTQATTVKCTFRHVSSDVTNLLTSAFAIRVEYDEKRCELCGDCTRSEASRIRSNLANVMNKYPQSWFSVTLPKETNHIDLSFNENVSDDVQISFGSLLSTSKFLIHETQLSNRTRWTLAFRDEQTLLIECQKDPTIHSSIRLTLPLRSIHKDILVIDGEQYSDIILSTNTITTDVRNINTIKETRLYGDDSTVRSLRQCSDILLRVSSKVVAEKFLDYLRLKHDYRIYYTMITIEHNQCKPWDRIEFNWYATEDAQYAISMLHSLGYLFQDKYLTNQTLQNVMIDLVEEDDKRFYQLAVQAFQQLQDCHWLDLTTIFNQKQFDQTQIEDASQSSYVGVVQITPTLFRIMPKEETLGHRAMRHESFGGANNFCRVDLQPDLAEKYIPHDWNASKYFRSVFESGIDIGRKHFHLFGSSSSQLRKYFQLFGTTISQLHRYSFWFLQAESIDEIDEKRRQLGRLDQIDNLGTYAARLGLWFSMCSPTGVKLSYCKTIEELNQRVQQGEMCVASISDVERNGFCFTDGNGLISKGLAKLIAENLPSRSKFLQKDVFPSAYQIRMAGCKGLLVVDPRSNFDQFYVKIRPSMDKFECDYWVLDICNTSQPKRAKLNNQIILVLSDLGVPDETFLQLQQQWFEKNPKYPSYSNALLKNKIPLPANKGRYMLGCAFENNLKAGTCFIRYEILDDDGESLPEPQLACVQGRVIVTKNPCPYAGDTVELTAVDLPELQCLSDVIVFSTEGDRPDFHKIAGSDLDGDGYFVYWGEEFQLQRTVPPLSYKAEEKKKHPNPITSKDLISYYLSTLSATSYGEIYNLHAVIVDRNDEKHPQPTCQELAIDFARMFASAIDSAKTGYVIDQDRIKTIREKYGQEYPDFLMKTDKPSYPSQAITGKLYRNAVAYAVNDKLARLSLSQRGSQTSLNSSVKKS